MRGNNPGIPASHGNNQVAYSSGVTNPVKEFFGICIATLHHLIDKGDKRIALTEGNTDCEEPIRVRTEFQEHYFHLAVIQ